MVLDNDQKVPYYVKGSLWISYDNEWSLQIKVNDRTVKSLLFLGKNAPLSLSRILQPCSGSVLLCSVYWWFRLLI